IEARAKCFENMADAVERTASDGLLHNFTMILEGGEAGLTFACGVSRQDLQSFFCDYCPLKMYQAHSSEWVGVGKLLFSHRMMDEAVFVRLPWEYDEDLERASAERLQPLPTGEDEK
ncbi:MAG TPA: hypothetical protein VFH61_15635, partial [Thermoleophilia bacterium]|nr:hypothetical protein [Thermoleophilia bacterium]